MKPKTADGASPVLPCGKLVIVLGSEAVAPLARLLLDEPRLLEKRQQAMQSVARLIREQILAPKGGPLKGNVHIHCGGGMHRSGMIAGVVERCVNGEPEAVVAAHYRYHVGYHDAEHPGGLEEGNLRFIRDFDCKLLDEAR